MFSLFRNIKVYFFIALVATTCYNQAQTSLSYRDRVIGCLYSDVCSDDEICFDDNAFGRCEELVEPGRPSSTYAYELDRKTLQLLGQEVARLKENGFDFKDDYAQCVLKKVLNDRPRLFYDPTACDSERVISPYVDLLITEPNAPDNTDNSAYSQPEEGQGDAVDAYLKEYGLPSNLLLKSTPQKSSSSKQTKKYLSPLSPHPSQSSPPLVSLSISPPLPKSKAANANSRVDGTPSDVKSKFSSSVNGDRDRDNGQPSGQSNGATKAKALPTKHLKRTPSLRFIGKNERQREEAREVKGGKHSDAGTGELDRSALSPEENRQLDRVVELLLTKLQSTEGAPLAELPTDDGYSRSAAEKPAAADGYDYRYAVDEDALSDGISFMGRPVTDEDVTQVLGNLDTIVEEQSAKSPAEALFRSNAPPVYRPRLYPVDVDIQDYSTATNKNDEGVVLIPLGRFFETNNRPIKPSVRVLRDTSEEAQELTVPAGRDSLEESSDLLSSLTPKDDEGIFLVDIIDKDKEDDSPDVRERERKEDEEIMEKILGEYIKKKSGINSDAVAEDISSLFDDGAEGEDDDGLGRKIDVKEILFGDINYNNNFDTKKPNFYRKHRYDIKKPGPKYWEEYFFKPDSSSGQSVEEEDANSSNEPVFIQPLLDQAKPPLDETPIVRKKDNSIRSNKPVSEGPVKVEAQSENTVIIRSAEVGEETNLEAVDSTHAYVITDKMLGEKDSQKFIKSLEKVFKLPRGTFSNLRKENYQLTFKVNPNYRELNASQVATQIEDFAHVIKNITGYSVKETGIGDKIHLPVVSARLIQNENLWFDLTVLIFAVVSAIITGAFLIFMWRRNAVFREKVKGFAKISEDWVNWDYQDLCRQRMKGQPGDEEKGAVNGESGKPKNVDTSLANQEKGPEVNPSPPSRSSTSSWVEEPVSSNMDITTGHVILTYMEDHLKKKDRLDQEWEALCAYEADPCSTNAANQKQNANKNRYPDVLPFDHSRVILNDLANASNSDYINANTITDHDPRNPSYIVTQGPLANTKADFWQMIWESGSVIIVMLSRLRENGLNLCDRYWPEEGSEAYQDYEVHLVSEHIWCDDYLVRSFYLKNLKTGETRTVTQFHFLSWPENGIPPNTKSILDFRRKVNKSYKGRSCPIVVHCSDGIGRTGTYILIDMVLNRLAKGAKEIDIAATLEHIRDQRSGLVKNKAQFEFVLLAIADEVQAILKALN